MPEEIHDEAVSKAVRLARLFGGEGFDDCTEEEVNTLIDANSDLLMEEDLLELTKSASEEVEEAVQEEQEEDERLSLERFGKIMRTQQSYIEEWDTFFERALKTIN